MSGARLRVDLDVLRGNLDALRRRIEPAQLMLVVKNDAYGHGAERVVAAAAGHGVRWFGAYDVPAGQHVRAVAGDSARVFSWATVGADEIADAATSRIELGVGDAGYLEKVASVSAGRRLPVHLKIDTGLHRNGVRPEAWDAFVARAAELEVFGDIRVVGVWSHIAEASDAHDDAARSVFVAAVDAARQAGLKPEVLHLAASAAADARPEFRFDVVRVGAFAYGIRSAGGTDPEGIHPVATLLAPVTRVGVGEVEVAHGSLDGFPSSLAGRVRVGTPAGPRELLTVGPTSCAVASWPGVELGNEVALFGPGARGESSATTLAEAIDTVGEEMLVRVSPRVPREYVGAG